MLDIRKQVTVNGETMIDGSTVVTYTAYINSDTPDNISYSSTVNNIAVKQAHEKECEEDAKAFEDECIRLQNSIKGGAL